MKKIILITVLSFALISISGTMNSLFAQTPATDKIIEDLKGHLKETKGWSFQKMGEAEKGNIILIFTDKSSKTHKILFYNYTEIKLTDIHISQGKQVLMLFPTTFYAFELDKKYKIDIDNSIMKIKTSEKSVLLKLISAGPFDLWKNISI